MNFTKDLKASGLKFVQLLVSLRLTMTKRQRRHQPWEMFHNLVHELWFYEYKTVRYVAFSRNVRVRKRISH